MAEIPVEKKSSSSWIWILLLLLLGALLLWWLFANDDDDDVVLVNADSDTVAASNLNGEADASANSDASLITTLGMLTGDASLVGRQVRLEGVSVNEVVGDMAFTVGEGDNETLVTFNQVPTPDTPMEGEIDVNPGSTVSIEGAVQAYDGNVPASVSREISESPEIFIDATNVTVAEQGATK